MRLETIRFLKALVEGNAHMAPFDQVLAELEQEESQEIARLAREASRNNHNEKEASNA